MTDRDPKPDNQGDRFYWSDTDEGFAEHRGPFPTREEAFAAAEVEVGETFFTARRVDVSLARLCHGAIHAGSVLEAVGERAYEEAFVASEGWPSIGETDELEQQLAAVLGAWLAKHDPPTFWTGANVQEHVLTDAEAAEPMRVVQQWDADEVIAQYESEQARATPAADSDAVEKPAVPSEALGNPSALTAGPVAAENEGGASSSDPAAVAEERAKRELDEWAEKYPVGTAVRFWPVSRAGSGLPSTIASKPWLGVEGGKGDVLVKVTGFPDGIPLDRIEFPPPPSRVWDESWPDPDAVSWITRRKHAPCKLTEAGLGTPCLYCVKAGKPFGEALISAGAHYYDAGPRARAHRECRDAAEEAAEEAARPAEVWDTSAEGAW